MVQQYIHLAEDHSGDNNERSVCQHDESEPPLLGEGDNECRKESRETLNYDREFLSDPCLYLLDVTGRKREVDEND